MKNNQLTFILVGVFFLTTLLTFWLGQKYNTSLHKLQDVATTLARMQNTKLFMDQLGAETIEFGKKNPSINPIIEAATNAAAATAKPH